VLAAIALDRHEFAPGLSVIRFFTSPGEVRIRNVCVSGARVRMIGHRLFERASDLSGP
jgi:hypothetical protein